MARQRYFKAGKLEDFKARGWLKITLYGRRIFVLDVDDELVAMDAGGIGARPCESPILAEYYGLGSMLLGSCDGSKNRQWGKVTQYPVKIDGDNIFVGSSSLS
ncbi:MAG: hypothetical protein V3W18_01840 [candidate division Zixibacteria bacterium]